MSETNREQSTFWNEQGGPRWVAMNRDLDAQLEAFGVATMERLQVARGIRVLDVGCGGGTTSRMLADAVAPGEVVGLDISAPLLEHARARNAGVDNLRFELADAQTYAFTTQVDAIFSRFGVMFFEDPVVAFRNLRTAIRDGGRIAFVCWRALSENPSFVVPLQAALPLLPEPPKPADPNAPGPFAFANGDRVRDILTRGGFSNIVLEEHNADLVFGGHSDLDGAVNLALQVGPLARAMGTMDEASIARIRAAVSEAFKPFHSAKGVVFPSATWLVTATAPNID